MNDFVKRNPILTVIFAALPVFGYLALYGHHQDKQLEKKITVLEKQKQIAVDSANTSMNTANELRAVNDLLKTQLSDLSEKAKNLDDSIKKQNSVVIDNRNRVVDVRSALPVRIASAELNRKLAELYPNDERALQQSR